jgi:hypothetical protein
MGRRSSLASFAAPACRVATATAAVGRDIYSDMPSDERDPRISEIFYYFESYTDISSGRTMGRKIGVVQEIIVKKLITDSTALRDSVIYEPRIEGYSGATHKVEFVFFQPIGAIALSPGAQARFPGPYDIALTLKQIDAAGRAKVAVAIEGEDFSATMRVGAPVANGELRARLDARGLVLKLSRSTEDRARFSLMDRREPRASIESKRVGAQRFSDSEALGSGIQTIEKAKQASLVAIDFDLAFNRTVLALSGRAARKYRSIVVLGNGVHWTKNDLSVLQTYVDYTYLANDAAIIRYAEYVRAKAIEEGREFLEYFMAYFNGMTKTPPDSFKVHPGDFSVMVPADAPPLLDAVLAQLDDYHTIEA